MEIRVTRARKIFSDGKHNAFTGIAALRGRTFVVFRSGATHMTYDGAIKVIASSDLERWEVAAESSDPGRDLRDPKVASFKGSLFVYYGARQEGKPHQSEVFMSSDGVRFGERQQLRGIPAGHWLWCVRPYEDVLYGTVYQTGVRPCSVALYRTVDGLEWAKLADFPVPGNEVSFDFDQQGRLWALVREDTYGSVPAVCVADPPYSAFKSAVRLPLRMQGPMLKRLEGGCAIACRRWEQPGRRNLRTDLLWLGDGQDLQVIRSLPSGGDTSYAGWLDLGPGAAVISYYSSHEHKMDEPHANNACFAKDGAHAEHSTPADIFLADISYA